VGATTTRHHRAASGTGDAQKRTGLSFDAAGWVPRPEAFTLRGAKRR
jgi:hypothetical protein